MFYEDKHFLSKNPVTVYAGSDFSYPPHLHEAFELIAVTEGTMTVRVDREAYALSGGQAVLVFPDQVHSLETTEHSRHVLAIFSPSSVGAFARDRIPDSPVFALSPALRDEILSLKQEDNILRIKGVLYLLCAAFDRNRTYHERTKQENALLMKIFDFVRRQFTGVCTLEKLAEEMGYSYVYLSRYFKERTGLSFTDYVNQKRVSEVCARLAETDESITQAALNCGFHSLRSFHRIFREQTGLTPSEYRHRTARG